MGLLLPLLLLFMFVFSLGFVMLLVMVASGGWAVVSAVENSAASLCCCCGGGRLHHCFYCGLVAAAFTLADPCATFFFRCCGNCWCWVGCAAVTWF